MSSREVIRNYDCSLDALMDGEYTYLQETYIIVERLYPVFGNNPNKRKPHNKRYEWEYSDAA